MAKSVFGKIVKATLGIAAVTGAAAAAGVAYGMAKWAKDDDSRDIKMTTGGNKGLHITKTDDGKFLVDTKYEWTDADYEEDEEENGIVIDLSRHAVAAAEEAVPAEEACGCGCEEAAPAEEACDCGCEEAAPAEEACGCGCEEAAPAEEACGCGCEEAAPAEEDGGCGCC